VEHSKVGFKVREPGFVQATFDLTLLPAVGDQRKAYNRFIAASLRPFMQKAETNRNRFGAKSFPAQRITRARALVRAFSRS